MELKEIKEKVCSTCSSEPVREHKTSQHCNGHWNEQRDFACGASIRFSPNYMETQELSPCPQRGDIVKQELKRTRARECLLSYIKKMKVDDYFKTEIMSRIRHI